MAPSVHWSGIGCPCLMLFMSSRMRWLRCVLVALYISPGIPSVSVALLFLSCCIVCWISLMWYGFVSHYSICGCLRMSCCSVDASLICWSWVGRLCDVSVLGVSSSHFFRLCMRFLVFLVRVWFGSMSVSIQSIVLVCPQLFWLLPHPVC